MRTRYRLDLSPSFQMAAVSLALVPLVTYLTFIAGVPFLGHYDYSGRIGSQLIGTLIIGGWLLWKWLVRREWAKTAVDLPIIALLTVTLLSTLFSTDPRRSLEGLLRLSFYVLVFYFLLDLRQHVRLWTGLLNAVVIVAGIACVLALVQLAWWYGDLPDLVHENPLLILQGGVPLPRLSVLGNPNILAIYLLLTFPLGVQRWLSVRRRAVRWLLGLALSAAILVFALTGSRGGLLGLCGAVVTGAVMLLRRSEQARLIARRGVVLAVVLLAATSLVVLSRGGLGLSGFTTKVRLESWSIALDVVADRPLLGSGPQTFGAQLLRYGGLEEIGDVHSHAHSLYMTIVAETGLLGILAVAWIAVGMLSELRQQQEAPAGFSVVDACIIGLVGRATHSLVDTFIEEPVIILLTLLLAAGAMPAFRASERRTSLARLASASAMFVIICGVGLWVNQGFAAHHSSREAAMVDDWQGAVDWLRSAEERDPAFRLYTQELAFAQGVLACADTTYLEVAIAQYDRSMELWPDWPLDHANLAALLAQTADTQLAIVEVQRAVELNPIEPLFACQLGFYLEDEGRLDEAIETYATCLALDPALASSSFWEGTPWRIEVRDQIFNRVESSLESRGGVLARATLCNNAGLYNEALTVVREYLKVDPNSTRARFEQARALAGIGNSDEALQILDDLIELDPLEGEYWMLRGRVHLGKGDLSAAAVDLENGASLTSNSEVLYWQGQLAEVLGDREEALRLYELAVAEATRPVTTRLAPSLSGRLPLPVEQLPCLPVLRSRESFLEPALRLASLLENAGRCAEAEEILNMVLSQEPYTTEVVEGLSSTDCVTDGD